MKALGTLTLLLTSSLVSLSSCTKERIIEKTISPERQADPKIENSITLSKKSNSVTLSKDSLGKAFILTPTVRTTGRQPDETFLKPLIISFEKYGDRLGLFNLTSKQLYSSIKADKLLQTFRIINENDKTIQVDLEKGLTSLNMSENLDILYTGSLADLNNKAISGQETSLNIKDSFVQQVSLENNTLYLEQVMRVQEQHLENKVDVMSAAASKNAEKQLTLVSSENSYNYAFEIKPYIKNVNFSSKIYDKNQRFGYFLNFALESGDEPIPYITKWDASDEKGPITVRLHADTPQAVRESVQAGALYWNKVFNKNIISIGADFKTGDRQLDRSIFIYWIPWDTAGYAKAAFQADPLSGEIFKGQVFMTSTFYTSTKNEFNRMAMQTHSIEQNTQKTQSLCSMTEKDLYKNLNISQLPATQVEKISQDIVTLVIAHETGHALGLRHNFAGSFNVDHTDEELVQYRANYLAGQENQKEVTTTTVMDYLLGTDVALAGQFIQKNTLPYDKSVINWGYLNHDPADLEKSKYQYCSDEHIMFANYNNMSIYGCNRFDKNKNQFNSLIEDIKSEMNTKVSNMFSSLVNYNLAAKSYYKPEISNGLTIINKSNLLSVDTIYQYKDFLYSSTSGLNFVRLNYIVDDYLNYLDSNSYMNDSEFGSIYQKDSENAGGLSEIIKSVLTVRKNNPHFFEQQATVFVNQLNYEIYKNLFSVDEFNEIKTKLVAAAKDADLDDSEMTLIKTLPAYINTTEYNPTEKTYKSVDKSISNRLSLGNTNELLDLLLSVYSKAFNSTARTVQINGSTLEIKLATNTYEYSGEMAAVRSFFDTKFNQSYKTRSTTVLRQMKSLAAANTITLLKAVGVSVPENFTSDQLKVELDKIDWTKIVGVLRFEFNNELQELKLLESL